MSKQIGLLSSLVASAVVTLAASSAQAQTPLQWAADLADHVAPSANAWGTPCAITWGDAVTGVGYSATTNGACLYTLSLKKSDSSINNALLQFWWGSANPSSPTYHDQIVAQNHFINVTDFRTAQPGDLLVSKYAGSTGNTGYQLILLSSESEGVVNGVERFSVTAVDSTRSPHGETDSRWNADGGVHDYGVGIGSLYVDANASTGEIVGHTWSTVANGSYYGQAERHLVAGRFVR